MGRHTAAWLAWSLGILWALLLALTFLLFALNLLHPGVEVEIVPAVGHFALIDPLGPAWPVVRDRLLGPT